MYVQDLSDDELALVDFEDWLETGEAELFSGLAMVDSSYFSIRAYQIIIIRLTVMPLCPPLETVAFSLCAKIMHNV